MRQVDVLLTPLPMCVVESVQQIQKLSTEHFPILVTTSSKLLLIYDDSFQNVLTQLRRRPTRIKIRSLPPPMKPTPIRASILTQNEYSPLKNKLIQYIEKSHHGIPTRGITSYLALLLF